MAEDGPGEIKSLCEKVKCVESRTASEVVPVVDEAAKGATNGKAKGGPIADANGTCVPSLGLSADACLACDIIYSEGKESEPKATKSD